MITQFKIVFTLGMSHPYYMERCEDFDFVLPADAARALGSAKLIAKVRAGTLVFLAETDEGGDPLISAAGKRLRIGFKLLNPFFNYFTDLSSDFNSKVPLFRNGASPGAIDPPQQAGWVSRLFSHPLSSPDRPVAVTLKNAEGQILQTETITGANSRSVVSYNLSGQAPGFYTIEESYPGSNVSVPVYFDPELQREGVFGVADIQIDGGFYITPPDLRVAFQPREETLKYYVVARNYSDADVDQLTVSDAGFSEEGRPEILFSKVAPSGFTADEIAPGFLGDSQAKVVLFKSQGTVPRQAKARKSIQLRKNGDLLIAHLPQPGSSKVNADLIIPISKP